MEWDCVSEDILLVVRGEKIPVDLSVLLAPGRRDTVSLDDLLETFSELVSFSDT